MIGKLPGLQQNFTTHRIRKNICTHTNVISEQTG